MWTFWQFRQIRRNGSTLQLQNVVEPPADETPAQFKLIGGSNPTNGFVNRLETLIQGQAIANPLIWRGLHRLLGLNETLEPARALI